MNFREELKAMLAEKSFCWSEEPIFRLVSGRMSNFYVNCKPTILNHRGMYLAGHVLFSLLRDAGIAAVGGLTFGADPIANAVAYTSALFGETIDAFSIRKEPKKHGTGQWIEGDVPAGTPVAIVDDVVSTGGSTITAIERARLAGLDIVRVIILVDRQETNGLKNIMNHVDSSRVSAVYARTELVREYQKIKGSILIPKI